MSTPTLSKPRLRTQVHGDLQVTAIDQLGYEVTRAANAVAALGALANGRRVDLVFSDIMMPGDLNGVELAREVRKRRSGLPVLLTSGYAEAAERHAGALGVKILPKPYRIDDLAAALQQAVTSGASRSQAK